MAEDAARSGAQGDADPAPKGEAQNTDAGSTGDAQPDVEKIVAARVAQKLKSYGDLDDLKRRAEAYAQVEESKKTEAERFAERQAAFEREKSDWERERQEHRVRTATVTTAARLGFRDPQDAYRLLDLPGVEFDEAGEPKNVEQQLKTLLEAKPYLSASGVSGTANGGRQGEGRPPGSKPSTNELLRAAFNKG